MTNYNNDALMTVDDVAAMLGVSTSTVYRWTNAGSLPVVRLGGKLLRFRRGALLAFLDRGPAGTGGTVLALPERRG